MQHPVDRRAQISLFKVALEKQNRPVTGHVLCYVLTVYGVLVLSNKTDWTCGAARKSPTSGVEEEEEENNEWRTMNERDGNWELKQSRRERERQGWHLGPVVGAERS